MVTSVSDVSADKVVSTEYPPDYAGRNVGRDIIYICRLLWLHLKRDPILGPVLWAAVLGLSFASSYLGLQIVLRMAGVTNGLVAHDGGAVSAALAGWFGIICLYFAYQTAAIALSYAQRIRMRTVLTADLLDRWLDRKRLYRPGQVDDVDYPEQRVQEDTFNFALWALDIVPSLVGAGASLFLYSQQLWQMSKPLPMVLPIAGAIVIPKALYVVAIVSALVVTILSHLVGRVLTRVEVVRQRVEAGFRHDLGMAREFAEQIVLSKGEKIEAARARHDYDLIRKNWTPYTILTAILTGIQSSSAQIGAFLPWLLLAPFALKGEIKVGDLQVAAAAYLSVFVVFASGSRLYLSFATLRAAAQRLHRMSESLSDPIKSRIQTITDEQSSFGIENLEITAGDDRPLFSLGYLRILAGEKWLVRGRSGSGKSTLFRTMAGIWPFGTGTIRQPAAESEVMFLPQKPYLPNGSLAELLSYPLLPDRFSTEDYRRVLSDACLGNLVDEVDQVRAWSKILSPGEQQRICLARALLQRPKFLFLDEATSSLDPETEAIVFETMTRQLAGSAIVTIAHTDKVACHHGHLLNIEQGRAIVSTLEQGATTAARKRAPKSSNRLKGEPDA